MDYYLKISCANNEKSEPRFSSSRPTPFRPKILLIHAPWIALRSGQGNSRCNFSLNDWIGDEINRVFPPSPGKSLFLELRFYLGVKRARFNARRSTHVWPHARFAPLPFRDAIRINVFGSGSSSYRVYNVSRVRLEFMRYVTHGKVRFETIYIKLRDSKYAKRKEKILE